MGTTATGSRDLRRTKGPTGGQCRHQAKTSVVRDRGTTQGAVGTLRGNGSQATRQKRRIAGGRSRCETGASGRPSSSRGRGCGQEGSSIGRESCRVGDSDDTCNASSNIFWSLPGCCFPLGSRASHDTHTCCSDNSWSARSIHTDFGRSFRKDRWHASVPQLQVAGVSGNADLRGSNRSRQVVVRTQRRHQNGEERTVWPPGLKGLGSTVWSPYSDHHRAIGMSLRQKRRAVDTVHRKPPEHWVADFRSGATSMKATGTLCCSRSGVDGMRFTRTPQGHLGELPAPKRPSPPVFCQPPDIATRILERVL